MGAKHNIADSDGETVEQLVKDSGAEFRDLLAKHIENKK